MNTDPARQAFDRLYGHLNLSSADAAWHVFKSGWEARENHMEDVLAMVDHFAGGGKPMAEQPAPAQEPVAWRELCRRLYVELFHCDQQMMATLDEDGEPTWTQGKTVRDVLADAKAALETSPPAPAQPPAIQHLPADDTEGGAL